MVSIKEAKSYPENAIEEHCGKLFNDNEIERATTIARELNGLTIEEANQLLDKMKVYITQSIFSPGI